LGPAFACSPIGYSVGVDIRLACSAENTGCDNHGELALDVPQLCRRSGFPTILLPCSVDMDVLFCLVFADHLLGRMGRVGSSRIISHSSSIYSLHFQGDYMEPKERIRLEIQNILKRRGDLVPLKDHDSLIFSGRIDSLNVLEIVGFLEKEFHLDISAMEFDPALFDSLESIVSLV
jgi:acyl carrier protein